jgi:hypothetical protein
MSAQIHGLRVTEGVQRFHITSLSGLHVRFSEHGAHQTIQCQLARSMAALESKGVGELPIKGGKAALQVEEEAACSRTTEPIQKPIRGIL